VLLQQGRQARAAAAGGLAADAGVDDGGVDLLLLELLFEQRDPAAPRVRPYSADRLSPSTSTVFGAE
jgi:hypothetical protein